MKTLVITLIAAAVTGADKHPPPMLHQSPTALAAAPLFGLLLVVSFIALDQSIPCTILKAKAREHDLREKIFETLGFSHPSDSPRLQFMLGKVILSLRETFGNSQSDYGSAGVVGNNKLGEQQVGVRTQISLRLCRGGFYALTR